jgi:hypothetical protein
MPKGAGVTRGKGTPHTSAEGRTPPGGRGPSARPRPNRPHVGDLARDSSSPRTNPLLGLADGRSRRHCGTRHRFVCSARVANRESAGSAGGRKGRSALAAYGNGEFGSVDHERRHGNAIRLNYLPTGARVGDSVAQSSALLADDRQSRYSDD